MQRHPVNAFTVDFNHQLIDVLKYVEDKQFQGLILQSNSPTVFSAGLDITELYKVSEERLLKLLTSFLDLWQAMYMSPLITIAAINGHAPAGGCVLALACDYRIMTRSQARIGLNEVMLGFGPPLWVTHTLENVIGTYKAQRAILTGRLFSPEEALDAEIVDQLVDSSSELLEKAEEEIDKFLKVPDAVRRTTKKDMHQITIEKIRSYHEQEIMQRVRLILSQEPQQSIGKYFEKLKKK